MLQDKIGILTPENIPFTYILAGPVVRSCAWLVDLILISMTMGVAACVLTSVGFALGPGWFAALFAIVGFLLQWGYGALCEWLLSGRTLGKALLGVRVLGQDGLPVTFSQAAVRNLLRLVDILPGGYLLGVLGCAFHPRRQRIGDLAAGTVVVRARGRGPRTAPSWPSDSRQASNASDVLPPISRELSDLVVAVAMRRDALPGTARQRLFGTLAQQIERQTAISRGPHEPAERYVLRWS